MAFIGTFHFGSIMSNVTCKSKGIISMILVICLIGVSHLNLYYTMHFPYVALAIKANAKKMNMQCKCM